MPDLQRIEQLYHDALDLPENKRAAFLAQACERDDALRREVESLLTARAEGGDFLREPAAELADLLAMPTMHEAVGNVAGEMSLLREQVHDANRSMLTQLRESQIDLLRECVSCGVCISDDVETCQYCGGAVMTLLPVERTIAGRYRLEKRIGHGGMGAVYQARDLRLHHTVAVKVLGGGLFGDATALRRFEREARAAARLNHPNIVPVNDHGVTQTGGAWMALEYVRGVTLRDELRRAGPLPIAIARDWFAQLVDGMQAAHAIGIIHRDLKPENIMIVELPSGERQARILDFGLAKLRQSDASRWSDVRSLTAAGILIGTPAYMAPEQFESGEADERTDIFALGVLLAEMLTGQHPFDRKSYGATRQAIMQEPYHLTGTDAALRRLDGALQKCLAKEPSARYAQLEKLKEELLPALCECSAEFISAQPEPRSAGQIRQTLQKVLQTKWLWSGAAVLLFLGLGYRYRLEHASFESEVLPTLKTELIADWKLEPESNDMLIRVSPDEKLIAFSKGQGGQTDIFVKPLGYGEPVRLTHDAWIDYSPIWSANGQEIIYLSLRDDQNEVWQIPRAGGVGKRIAILQNSFTKKFVRLLRWARNGQRIFFLTGCNVYTIDLASGAIKQSTKFQTSPCKINTVDISADEQWIAYDEESSGVSQIFAMSLNGNAPLQLTSEAEENNAPFWHPDGKRLIYQSKRNGVRQICVAYLDGRPPLQLTFDHDHLTPWFVSPNSHRILYSTRNSDADLFRYDLGSDVETRISAGRKLEISPTIAPDGKTVAYQQAEGEEYSEQSVIWSKQVTEDAPPLRLASDACDPRWSPQGGQLAFLRMRDDQTSLWTINADGTNEQVLVNARVWYGGLYALPFRWIHPFNYSWASDGRHLAYVSYRDGVFNVRSVMNNGQDDHPVSANDDPALKIVCPIFAPDNQRIAYLAFRSNSSKSSHNVMITGDGQQRSVFQATGNVRLLGWSSTAEHLFVAFAENVNAGKVADVRLLRIPATSGPSSLVARLPAAYVSSFRPAERHNLVAYVTRKQDHDELWRVSLIDGRAQKISTSNDPLVYFAELVWAPDAHAVYYSKQSNAISLWAIDNFR